MKRTGYKNTLNNIQRQDGASLSPMCITCLSNKELVHHLGEKGCHSGHYWKKHNLHMQNWPHSTCDHLKYHKTTCTGSQLHLSSNYKREINFQDTRCTKLQMDLTLLDSNGLQENKPNQNKKPTTKSPFSSWNLTHKVYILWDSSALTNINSKSGFFIIEELKSSFGHSCS